MALLLILAAVGLRAALVQSSQLPLGDGGFFFQSVIELQENGFIPPGEVTYNQINTPNIYPPLALYIVGWLAQALDVPLLELFRWYPVAVSGLALGVFYWFARTYFEGARGGLLATAVLALMPDVVLDMTSGGGVVRATGMLFAVLALQQGYQLILTHRARYVLPAALAFAMAVMTQPQWGGAAVLGLLVLAFASEGAFEASVRLFIMFLLVTVVALGWVYYVAEVQGETLRPFSDAILNQIEETPLLVTAATSTELLTGEPFVGVLAGLMLLGLFVCLANGRVELVVWLLLAAVVPLLRSITLSLPIALVTAAALDTLVLVGLGSFRVPGRYDSLTGERLARGSNWAVFTGYGAVIVVLLATAAGAVRAHVTDPLRVQSSEQQAALRWIAERTEPDSVFLVVTGAADWQSDPLSEWFPVLAERSSYVTVQASAWLQDVPLDVTYVERADRYARLQSCVQQEAICLEQVIPPEGTPVYVYLAANVNGSLRPSLLANDRYQRVYPIGSITEDDVLIFQRTS